MNKKKEKKEMQNILIFPGALNHQIVTSAFQKVIGGRGEGGGAKFGLVVYTKKERPSCNLDRNKYLLHVESRKLMS